MAVYFKNEGVITNIKFIQELMHRGYQYGSLFRAGYSMPKSTSLLQKYPEDIQCVYPSTDPLRGSIYVSNVEAAQNPRTLARYNIKAVMTCARGYDRNIPKSKLEMFQYFPFDDKETCIISPYFEKATDFIAKACEKTNILVHCIAGVSRSVSMVLAYLIRQKGMSYEDAYHAVKSRRNIISPNDGFIKQLKDYAQQVRRRMNNNTSQKFAKQPILKQQKNNQKWNELQSYQKTIQKSNTTELNYKKYPFDVQNEQDYDLTKSTNLFADIRKNKSSLQSTTPKRNKINYNAEFKNNSTILKKGSLYEDQTSKTPEKLIIKEDLQNILKTKKDQFENRTASYKQRNRQLNDRIQAIHAKYQKQRQQLFANRGYSSNAKRDRVSAYDRSQKVESGYKRGYDLEGRSWMGQSSSYLKQTTKYTTLFQNKYERGLKYADVGRTGYGLFGGRYY